MTGKRLHFIYDIFFMALSVAGAVLLSRSGFFSNLVTGDYIYLKSFIAGLFFTSAFTTAPAIAALGKISGSMPSIWPVVFFGGIGAMIGDLIILKFMKDRFSEDIFYVLGKEGKKFRAIFKVRFFRWFTFFFGAIILASPVPDEIGLMMMGLSRTTSALLVPTSLFFNTTGILLIALAARLI